MPSIITRARGRVLFSGTQPPSEETADRWLIRLRWVAVIGMLVTTLVARRLVPALPTPPLLVTVAAIAALNAFWMLWMRRRARRGREQPPYMGPQIVGDVLALSV